MGPAAKARWRPRIQESGFSAMARKAARGTAGHTPAQDYEAAAKRVERIKAALGIKSEVV